MASKSSNKRSTRKRGFPKYPGNYPNDVITDSTFFEKEKPVKVLIAVADIRGYTYLINDLTDEKVSSFLQRVFEDILPKSVYTRDIRKRQPKEFVGCTYKLTGDGFLAVYSEDEGAVKQAVKNLLYSLGRYPKIKKKAGMRIEQTQLSTAAVLGEVLRKKIETCDYRDFTIIGREVNLAFRLCDVTYPGQLLVNNEVVRILKEDFTFVDTGSVKLKGFDKRERTYAILREKTRKERDVSGATRSDYVYQCCNKCVDETDFDMYKRVCFPAYKAGVLIGEEYNSKEISNGVPKTDFSKIDCRSKKRKQRGNSLNNKKQEEKIEAARFFCRENCEHVVTCYHNICLGIERVSTPGIGYATGRRRISGKMDIENSMICCHICYNKGKSKCRETDYEFRNNDFGKGQRNAV